MLATAQGRHDTLVQDRVVYSPFSPHYSLPPHPTPPFLSSLPLFAPSSSSHSFFLDYFIHLSTIPPFYWGTPDITEHYVPTLSSATVAATHPTLALPATDISRTVWLSVPTPDAVDTLARSNIPERFMFNNLEASASS